MAIIERDVVLQGMTEDGQKTIDLPITALKNIEDTADVKENPTSNDYIPVIDSEDSGQMKKVPFSAFGSSISTTDVLTLSAGNWTDSKTQKVSINVDTNKRNVVDVAASSLQDWGSCGVYASKEESDGITFSCAEIPSVDLQFYVTSMEVNRSAG